MRIGPPFFHSVGLLLLPLAFLFSCISVISSEAYHLVLVLDANPNAYIHYVWWAVLFGLLPIATSLTFLIVAHVKEKEALTAGEGNFWLFVLVGGFCIFWGSAYSLSSYETYFDAIARAHRLVIASTIDGFLLRVYAVHSLCGVLWITAGIFLATTTALRTHKLLKEGVLLSN